MWVVFTPPAPPTNPPAQDETNIASSIDLGGEFALTDHTGTPVTEQDFLSKYALIYFGYTYCPDICPTELAKMTSALSLLPQEQQEMITPVFITIDPERDSPEALANYVSLFSPRLVGLTGTPEQVAQAAEGWRVYYARVEPEGSSEYLMDHSTFTYLMGPDGDLVDLFRLQDSVEEMAQRLQDITASYRLN